MKRIRKRAPGFWSSAKVQSIIRLAVRGKLSWETAAQRVNALTRGIAALPVARIRWRGTHAKGKARRKTSRTRKVASQ